MMMQVLPKLLQSELINADVLILLLFKDNFSAAGDIVRVRACEKEREREHVTDYTYMCNIYVIFQLLDGA
jgi:hypothetical protein